MLRDLLKISCIVWTLFFIETRLSLKFLFVINISALHLYLKEVLLTVLQNISFLLLLKFQLTTTRTISTSHCNLVLMIRIRARSIRCIQCAILKAVVIGRIRTVYRWNMYKWWTGTISVEKSHQIMVNNPNSIVFQYK